ncbi:Winged helix-turn-helix transcription repressor DNA-binding [Penicillium bovifimosum]|uniref:Winged helix-turn-helix transcription repressor DNA-binding n=1 Tax=Penicillium bovifimosum TaxID=126998 RepID=A0A9W9GIL5_9EURO|nr:Winged helix-turn-helix transcription repressor DNA-binding [Penicillium bovifimosum]KAJ5121128.1 Winged helix-turn-helix transcription repressor DNA-binding [Penicillium bovifimosum]
MDSIERLVGDLHELDSIVYGAANQVSTPAATPVVGVVAALPFIWQRAPESWWAYRKLQNQRKTQYAANRAPQRQSTGKGNHTMKVLKPRSANSPHGERNDAHHQQIMTHEYGPTSRPSIQQYM